MEPILRAEKLTKRFGELTANREIDIEIHAGEIHAIAGENGAGKSTLMKMLYGVYQPTAGNLYIDGEKMERWNPTIAREKGIGMVFQDFRIVPAFTVLENVFLSLHSAGWKINKKKLRDEINRISAEYRLSVDPDTEVWKLDLGQRQHVEILKILLDPQTRVMIFDEPTSVLAPHEVQAFLQMLSGFRNKGYGIFLITHKIDEILAVADRITILRQGEHVCTFERRDGFSQQQIISAMMGNVPVNFELERPECSEENEAAALQLSLSGVSIKDDHDQLILHDVSFEMHKAEILGIAGISGNGQRELAEAIYGARKLQSGILSANEEDISSTDIAHRIRLGMRMVTEDPIRDNVVPTFSILENMALVGLDPIYRHGDMDWQAMRSQLQTHSEVKTLRVPQAERIAGTLSGGNLQRMTFARAVISRPRLLIASYPSRGLDIATVHAVHKTLFRLKKQGVGTILISEDISELFTMCDRILVLSSHTAFGPYCVDACTPNEIGKIMLQGENAHE